MSAAWLVVLTIVGLWLFGVTWLTIADGMMRRRYESNMQMRRWDETVQALRRMADEEGDA